MKGHIEIIYEVVVEPSISFAVSLGVERAVVDAARSHRLECKRGESRDSGIRKSVEAPACFPEHGVGLWRKEACTFGSTAVIRVCEIEHQRQNFV